MLAHIRANVIFLVATLVICSILYPLAILAVGQGLFPEKASGSLIRDGERVIGSRLIAQKFEGPGYFQPRPSAAGYNAAASGGSNYGANNIKLRQRVAAQLADLVSYKSGPSTGLPVGPDVTLWFIEQTNPMQFTPGDNDLVTRWAKTYPTLASEWVKSDAVTKDYVKNWPQYADLVKSWRKDNPDAQGDPDPEQLATYFFASFAREHPQQWPRVTEVKDEEGKSTGKKIELIPAKPEAVTKREDAEGLTEIQETFFDLWLQAHPQADLEKVPADMVTASGSGLDPHISLASARFQSKRVSDERGRKLIEEEARKTGAQVPEQRQREIKEKIHKAVEELVGSDPLVNVLEINLALDDKIKQLAR